MICPNCGYNNDDNVSFCVNCGSKQGASVNLNGETVNTNQENANAFAYTNPYGEPKAETSLAAWVGVIILCMIPVVNIIMLIIWACQKEKKDRRNFAGASLIVIGIQLVLSFILSSIMVSLLLGFFGASSLKDLTEMLDNYSNYGSYNNDFNWDDYDSDDYNMDDSYSFDDFYNSDDYDENGLLKEWSGIPHIQMYDGNVYELVTPEGMECDQMADSLVNFYNNDVTVYVNDSSYSEGEDVLAFLSQLEVNDTVTFDYKGNDAYYAYSIEDGESYACTRIFIFLNIGNEDYLEMDINEFKAYTPEEIANMVVTYTAIVK